MSARVLSWKTGLVVAVLAIGVAWASIGPDSILQNQIFDDLRAWRAHGRLVQVSDDLPVGDRYALLYILGRNGAKDIDGPSEGELRQMVGMQLPELERLYLAETGRLFLEDVVVFGYWYNSDLADPVIANDLRRKLEAHSYFTRSDTMYSAIVYSKGTNVTFWHWSDKGDRKLETIVACGGPQLGAPLADRTLAKQALSKTLGLPMKLIDLGFSKFKVDLSSAGTQWLTPMYQPLIDRRKQHPLTGDWYLIAGKTTASGGSKLATYFDIANWFDSISLNEGLGQDVPAYRLGARALQSIGIEASDGMVPVKSALCEGYAGEAHTFILRDHNHSQMLQGNGGTELCQLVMQCLMPRITAHRDKRVRSFELWLPESPCSTMFLVKQSAVLNQAQIVGVRGRGELAVLNQDGSETVLQLPTGEYDWPQWVGESNIVAERIVNGGHNIVMIRGDYDTVQLTANNHSRYPTAQDDGSLVVFESEDDLVVRSVGGMAQVLVEGGVTLDSPPVFLGDTVYFANVTSDGRHELRKVAVSAKSVSVAETELVAEASDIVYPMRVGDCLLAFQRDGEKLRPMAVTRSWAGLVNVEAQAGVKFLSQQSNLPSIDEVEVTSGGQVYVVVDRNLRWLDTSKLSRRTRARLEELRRRIKGEQPQSVPAVTWEELLSLAATDLCRVDSK